MRFIFWYLAAYFSLIAGAVFTLWQSGTLAYISPAWFLISVAVAVGLGVLLAVTTASPTPATRH